MLREKTMADTYLKQLRNWANMTQDAVAQSLGMARSTYAGIEQGVSELSSSELRKLAALYGLTPAEILEEQLPENYEPNQEEALRIYQQSLPKADIVPREINPEINPEKLRNVLLYLLDRVGAKPNVGETVIYKLLYFIDFDYYEKNGRSITGLTYIKNSYGPTPAKGFKDLVQGMVNAGELEIVETSYFNHLQKKYLPVVHYELSALSADELCHIDDEIVRLGSKSAVELSEFSHKDMPWAAAENLQPIDYQLAMYRTALTSVAEYDDDL
jgi:transcriptional regulator with XRE-family HTH domain